MESARVRRHHHSLRLTNDGESGALAHPANPATVDQSTFFISIPQQQRGLLSPPPPGFAPRVT
jgi:hypothetical protein